MPNICIIGLGNPGTKYNGTRHNVGKDWIKSIAADSYIELKSKKKIESSVAISPDKKILWGYPDQYVNESGYSINKILNNNNFKLDQIIIIHDDLDLPIGSLKLKIGGGHGGHNGLRSIISHAGKSFIRLRVGIGHPGNKVDVTNWVLGKFKVTEKDLIKESFFKFNNIIELLGDNDFQNAQLRLHSE
ncbi:aminoacyl-tRNA hydrolase [Pseudomonadota bacterium]|nr:aminoacyl-tRNA hydrolase [Pseudomonadota bacterium]